MRKKAVLGIFLGLLGSKDSEVNLAGQRTVFLLECLTFPPPGFLVLLKQNHPSPVSHFHPQKGFLDVNAQTNSHHAGRAQGITVRSKGYQGNGLACTPCLPLLRAWGGKVSGAPSTARCCPVHAGELGRGRSLCDPPRKAAFLRVWGQAPQAACVLPGGSSPPFP